MTFGIYLPPQAESKKVPVVYWLSGLTCTEQNFITKAGSQKHAAEHGIAIVCPDTSPRGLGLKDEDVSIDYGTGAGFYVDATEEPWKTNYRMYSYVTKELPEIVEKEFNVVADKKSVCGHSMGGHGAMILALKNPGVYRSVSVLAPVCKALSCDKARTAFTHYLGVNEALWKQYDSTELVKTYSGPPLTILVDQGDADPFLHQGQLLPDQLVAASAENSHVDVQLRMQEGYDHSYYFIATFFGDHIKHHADALHA